MIYTLPKISDEKTHWKPLDIKRGDFIGKKDFSFTVVKIEDTIYFEYSKEFQDHYDRTMVWAKLQKV